MEYVEGSVLTSQYDLGFRDFDVEAAMGEPISDNSEGTEQVIVRILLDA
jgi:hypothetical protein